MSYHVYISMALLMINLHFIISFQLFPLISPVESSRLTSRRFVLIKLLFILVSSKETDPTTCHCKKYSSPKVVVVLCFGLHAASKVGRCLSRYLNSTFFFCHLIKLLYHSVIIIIIQISICRLLMVISFHSIRRVLCYNLEHKAEESA